MADQIRVQIIYEREHKGIVFRDAIYLTEDEWAVAKEDTKAIEAEKQTRYDRWVNVIENPPLPVKLTEAEAQAEVNELTARLAIANLKLAEAKEAIVKGVK